jgi:hypothetical protein
MARVNLVPSWIDAETGDVTVRDGRRVLSVRVRVLRWHPGFWLYVARLVWLRLRSASVNALLSVGERLRR